MHNITAFNGSSRTTGSTNSLQSETTTRRSLVLKEIRQLQKQEAALGKKLAELGNDFSAMSERIELEHQMHSIEEQIAALQILLLQDNADQKVQLERSSDGDEAADQAESQSPKSTIPIAKKNILGVTVDTFA